jgi:isopentenyldiphosphate isomerase
VLKNPAAELVTILDDDGHPCGVATRGDVRRKNLLHGATAILVRRSDGRIYVHRRTTTKDIYPGAFDCWAGGVLAAGEPAEAGALRELAEELGVEHVALRPLLTTRWNDAGVQAIYHVYAATWDGPIVHQEDEIAWGEWWTPEDLAARLAEPDFPFVPDGRRLLELTGVLAAASTGR